MTQRCSSEIDILVGRRARRRRVWLVRLFVAVAALVVALPAASAVARPLTVTITHVECIDDCDATGLEAALEGHADFYAKVFINGNVQQTPRTDDNPSIDPFWQVSQDVPSSLTNVPVGIQIWDYDSTSGDDLGDVSPTDNDNGLDFVVNYDTAQWSGGDDGLTFPETCSTGDGGANDEPRVKVCFDVSTSNSGDFDGDGIPDSVERFGMPDAGGNLTPIPGMAMDPCRKTIAIQIDSLTGAADGHTHRPTDLAVADAKAAMNAAPVPATAGCPYAGFPQQSNGVNLVIDRRNNLPEQEVFTLDDLVSARDSGKLAPQRRPYMHYAVFAHDQAKGSSSSGLCCRSNRDFLVTLGRWSGQVGTDRDQAGSILHELGHSLVLGHGGGDGTNYKPNYLSVMNYSFDPTGIPDPTIPANIDTNGDGVADQSYRLDYSRSALPSLVESSLNEAAGIGDGTDQTVWLDPAYKARTGAGNAALDWNQVGGSAQSPYAQDVNRDFCVEAGVDGTLDTTPAGDDIVQAGAITSGPDFICSTTKSGDDAQTTPAGTNVLSTLTGYDDWSNINYRAAMSVTAGGADLGHTGDITFEVAQKNEQQTYALFDPDLTLSKDVDKADASSGSTLTYTLTAHNDGTGDAKTVALSDTLPDGSTASPTIGGLAAGAQASRTVTYTVPCATADGAVLTNRASVSGTNLLNNAEQNTANNRASATTTVHAPLVTIAKTATSTLAAGEAITYRLTYQNTGSGDASAIQISDVVPAGVYYSTVLDGGAGPKPTTVTPNADGTRTLTWSVGALAGASGPRTIEYRARPTLLALGGTQYVNSASLSFTNASGCVYAVQHASATSTITVLPPTRDPMTIGYWRNHPLQWTAETLARIQATDQRFDGADLSLPDGALSGSEVNATLMPSALILRQQLLGVYFNLAERRINAATQIASKTATSIGVTNVREAALYAIATLALAQKPNAARYSNITTVLDEINRNTSEVY